jgi:hypothetical protein
MGTDGISDRHTPPCNMRPNRVHCWHPDDEAGPGGPARICCYCGRREVRSYEKCTRHGPYIPADSISVWVERAQTGGEK